MFQKARYSVGTFEWETRKTYKDRSFEGDTDVYDNGEAFHGLSTNYHSGGETINELESTCREDATCKWC